VDSGKYTAVVTSGDYVVGIWHANNSDTVIKRAQKLIESISSKTASDIGVTNTSMTGREMNPKLPDILPKSDGVKGWKIAKEIEIYNEQNLVKFMHDETEVYQAYDFVELALAEYRNPRLGSEPILRAEIYDMGTPENAFGIYTFNRNPQADFKIIGNETAITMLTIDTWKGKYFVHIRLYEFSDDIREGAENIAKYMINQIRGTTKPPDILKLLPQDSFVKHSERYFRDHTIFSKIHTTISKNILNLNESTIGLAAEYLHPKSKNPRDTLSVFLIKYPNPEYATTAYNSYRAYLVAKGYSTIETQKLDAQSTVFRILPQQK